MPEHLTIEDDDRNWFAAMLAGESPSNAGFLRRLANDPDFADIVKLPFAEARAWLEARKEDLERRCGEVYREYGFMAPRDAELLIKVFRGADSEALSVDLIAALRTKKRLGRRQRELLDIWDQYYAGKEREFSIPLDAEIINEVEAEWERRETERTQAKAAGA